MPFIFLTLFEIVFLLLLFTIHHLLFLTLLIATTLHSVICLTNMPLSKLKWFILELLNLGLLLSWMPWNFHAVGYKKSGLALILQCLRSAPNKYHAAIIKAKRTFHASTISSNLSNPRKLWHTVNKLLHRGPPNALPSNLHSSKLSNSFASFFSSKIHKIRIDLQSNSTPTSPHIPCPHTPPQFDVFRPASIDEISKLISQSPETHCDLDPIPSTLLKKCMSALLPTITKIINLSLASGVFLDQFKSSSVHPLIKNKIWLSMNFLITGLFLIFLSYPNLLSVLLKFASLTFSWNKTF